LFYFLLQILSNFIFHTLTYLRSCSHLPVAMFLRGRKLHEGQPETPTVFYRPEPHPSPQSKMESDHNSLLESCGNQPGGLTLMATQPTHLASSPSTTTTTMIQSTETALTTTTTITPPTHQHLATNPSPPPPPAATATTVPDLHKHSNLLCSEFLQFFQQ